jgi:hypothetical protein
MSGGDRNVLVTFGAVSLRNSAGGKMPIYDACVAFGAGR